MRFTILSPLLTILIAATSAIGKTSSTFSVPSLNYCLSFLDYKTDAVIQSTLRRKLDPDVTVITVAHRLQTIMDADKIVRLLAHIVCYFNSLARTATLDGP